MASQFSVLPILLFVLLMIATGIKLSECTNFTILNNCKETIWPGITANNNLTSDNGFDLKPGQSAIFTAPSGWGVVITPVNGKGNCSVAGCESDLRSNCPPELALVSSGKTIACRSACNVFNTDEYCCRGAYSDPVSCVPTNYSKIFKQACPVAYSYAHDDRTSVLTCSTTDYIVTFCSSKNQTQCTYHDKKLVCSHSGSVSDGLNSKAFFQRWWILMLPLLPILTYLPF
ncbi:hypothetical protein LOK49_LG02G02869 [Camellia lanceoleosa]|uniref:Uncharacterized protein n=1 Tax=Camellia lanceoleosa TaxID=1840588 RepID=A0ACC0IRX8_9ERIC|nr:hypothetical protein LOK49_LG02G02869 [Camellia lanceoleosa]